jgi:hypothetical protein
MEPKEPIANLRAIVSVYPDGTLNREEPIYSRLGFDELLFKQLSSDYSMICDCEGSGVPVCFCVKDSKKDQDGANWQFYNLEEVLDEVRMNPEKQFWVSGGGDAYELLTPYCSEILQTIVRPWNEGDRFFHMPPFFERGELKLAHPAFKVHLWHRAGEGVK